MRAEGPPTGNRVRGPEQDGRDARRKTWGMPGGGVSGSELPTWMANQIMERLGGGVGPQRIGLGILEQPMFQDLIAQFVRLTFLSESPHPILMMCWPGAPSHGIPFFPFSRNATATGVAQTTGPSIARTIAARIAALLLAFVGGTRPRQIRFGNPPAQFNQNVISKPLLSGPRIFVLISWGRRVCIILL